MNDLISRNDAYNTLTEYYHHTTEIQHKALREALERVPSAQPIAKDINVPVKVKDCISRQAAIDAMKSISDSICGQQAIDALCELPSTQPETHEKRTETHACDCIDRKAAIDALKEHRALFCDNTPDTFSKLSYAEKSRVDELDMAIATLINLPSAQPEMLACGEGVLNAQPEQTNSWCINSWCIDCKEYDTENKCCPRYNRVIKQTLDEIYSHAETEAEAKFNAEIVRCKDCKYSDTDNTLGVMFCWRVSYHEASEDGFCSWAERRTDG